VHYLGPRQSGSRRERNGVVTFSAEEHLAQIGGRAEDLIEEKGIEVPISAISEDFLSQAVSGGGSVPDNHILDAGRRSPSGRNGE
jgi:hypothetical protein